MARRGALEIKPALAKRELISDHIEHCLEEAVAEGLLEVRTAVRDRKALAKYL
jgi:uncharacterized protein